MTGSAGAMEQSYISVYGYEKPTMTGSAGAMELIGSVCQVPAQPTMTGSAGAMERTLGPARGRRKPTMTGSAGATEPPVGAWTGNRVRRRKRRLAAPFRPTIRVLKRPFRGCGLDTHPRAVATKTACPSMLS